METVQMLVCFGGGWETSSDGRYAYKGGRVKGIRIAKETTYQDFVRELYGRIEVDENEYGLKLEVLWGSSTMPLPPMEICNDVDLQFFFGGAVMSDNSYVPLCITLVPKVVKQSPVQQISNCHTHYDSGSGSNQVTPTMPTLNEPELETLPASVPVETFEEQLPTALPQLSPPVLSQPLPINDDAVHVHLDTQDHPKTGDGNATNFGDADIECEVKGDPEQVRDDAAVKDDAPVDNGNGLDQKAPNARSSRRIFRYLPSCIDSSIKPRDETPPLDDDNALSAGQIFPSKKELQKSLSLHAINNHYQYKVSRSTKERFEAICVNENCKWRARATKSRGTENFELRRLDRHHSCATDESPVGHRQASSRVIGKYIKKLMEEKQCQYKPKQIRDDILKNFGIELSYDKCWRAKQSAIREIRGSAEKSPPLFPSTAEKVKRRKCCSSDISQRKCGQCGAYGHNRQTCKTDKQESDPSPTSLKDESLT